MTAAPVCPCAAWTDSGLTAFAPSPPLIVGWGVSSLCCAHPASPASGRSQPAVGADACLPVCGTLVGLACFSVQVQQHARGGGRGRVSEQAGTARPVFPGASSEAEGPPGARPLELAASAPPSLVLLWASAPLSGGGGAGTHPAGTWGEQN